ncbi:MAG: NADP-dependent isocitrate dehydrogenase, partial [Candidatus Thorarchaeota archaeon]|nr:NADP-dependent isocitrate dehydrogenase [Candidatus Thorarchaeota archaeon]
MSGSKEKIIYTKVDEAPALATYSFLPIVKAFTEAADVTVETRDISLAGRIIANFPEHLTSEQKQPNDLSELGELVKKPEANIIKLPCISASIPQLNAAVKELQDHGYKIPDYPAEPKNDEEKEIKARFDKIKGSAVNPVLRMGNSDRRVPAPVKNYAKKNPHSMGAWNKDSLSHVAHMKSGDLRSNETSVTLDTQNAGDSRIEFVDKQGNTKILKDKLTLLDGEIIDGTFMSKKKLRAFLKDQMEDAKKKDILFSVHLKATMMKVSDPIIFGHVVSVFFKTVFEKHASVFKE